MKQPAKPSPIVPAGLNVGADEIVIANLCACGDKDVAQAAECLLKK